MRVFLSAGEPSGDHHAALLVRALRAHPDFRDRPEELECVGLGGPQMAAEGCALVADLTELAVMWIGRTIVSIHRFVEMTRRAERSFLEAKPDVCVLVDFPGFHWWLAWRAKRHGIPVVFYCPPQIWAWASWRIGKMRRLVDHVLSALPFEHDWFLERGMSSTLVGHPFFDEACSSTPATEAVAPEGPIAAAGRDMVLLLPGSRTQEIVSNLPTLLASARRVRARLPEVRCVVGALHERHAERIRESVRAAGLETAVEVIAGRTHSLIQQAHCAIAVSGSVSLELLQAHVPTVIVYRIGPVAYVVQSWCRHARFITLVNLLAVPDPLGPVQGTWAAPREVVPADPRAIYPEYLSVQDPSAHVAGHLLEWLEDPAARERVVTQLEKLAAAVAVPGSAAKAAAAVLALAGPAGKLTAAVRDRNWDRGAEKRGRGGNSPHQARQAA
jgi:lipid-A-disaccharide synthase